MKRLEAAATVVIQSLDSIAVRIFRSLLCPVNKISKKNTEKFNEIKCLVDENDNLDHSCELVQNVGISTYFEHRLLLG